MVLEIGSDGKPMGSRLWLSTPDSESDGRFVQWRGDGRELFFLSADYKLMAVNVKLEADSVETSAPRELFALRVTENFLSPYEAAPDGQRSWCAPPCSNPSR